MSEKKTYTAADIQRYLNGEMAAVEMHALEKAALDDPFLDDALAGYRELEAPPDRNLEELAQRLAKRIEPKRKSFSLPLFRVAAVVILLAGAGFFVYNFLEKKMPLGTTVARTENLPNAQADTVATVAPMLREQNAEREISPKRTARQPLAERPVLAPPAPSTQMPRMAAKEEERMSNMASAKKKEVAVMSPEPSSEILTKPQAESKSFFDKKDPGLRQFQGTILTGDQQPVAGAVVMAGPEAYRTVGISDQTGSFHFFRGDDSVAIEIQATGYQGLRRIIRADGEMQPFQLAASAPAVRKMSTSSRDVSQSTVALISFTTSHASPVRGWEDYYAYLEAHSAAFESRRPLRFSFFVNRTGNITLKEDTAAPGAVLEIIRNGPAWLVTGDPGRVTVDIR